MYGIENLKKVAVVAIGFGVQTEKAFKDGFQTADLFGYIPVVASLPEIFANKDLIVQEFKDLDATERAEIAKYVADTLTLENKDLEDKIEAGLVAVVAVVVLIYKFKKAEEAPVVQ